MSVTLDGIDILQSFVNAIIGAGNLAALATICLLQYLFYLVRQSRTRQRTEQYEAQLSGLTGELNSAHRERSLAMLENRILRDFVAQTDLDRSLDLILRRFILNPREEFAAFLIREGDRFVVQRHRGLAQESVSNLVLESRYVHQLLGARHLTLQGAELRGSPFTACLSNGDRGKARALTALAIGLDGAISGLFVTTMLYPQGATREQQLELARRLMVSVATGIQRSQTLAKQEHRLRTTSEMLELRAITDRRYDGPAAMIGAFLDGLRTKIDADRATLFFGPSNAVSLKPMVRCGLPFAPHLLAVWQSHEQRLVDTNRGMESLTHLQCGDLSRIGIQSLMSEALLVPLSGLTNHDAILCLTRQQADGFGPLQRELASWSANHLSEAIARTMAQASVERAARQDGLTELANRRAFDARAEEELLTARQRGTECSLLLLDLDRFKSINDTYGHLAGDEVLRQTANVLRRQVTQIRSGERALIARYGGEEIAVLLPGIGLAGAQRVAETIRSAIEATTITHEHREINVTTSIGIAGLTPDMTTVQQLVAVADAGLYEAKQTGRNRVVAPRVTRTQEHDAFRLAQVELAEAR